MVSTVSSVVTVPPVYCSEVRLLSVMIGQVTGGIQDDQRKGGCSDNKYNGILK